MSKKKAQESSKDNEVSLNTVDEQTVDKLEMSKKEENIILKSMLKKKTM